MTDILVFQYTCRRCGLTHDRGTTKYDNAVPFLIMIETLAMGQAPPGLQHRLTDIHSCADGGYGVSDLIGGDRRED